MDLNQSCVGLINGQLGTAFTDVRKVAENLDLLEPLFTHLGGNNLQKLIDMAPDLGALLSKLTFFQDVYYGDYPVTPEHRPSGKDSENGDLYYDTTRQTLMVYENGVWVPVAGVENKVEVIRITGKQFHGSDAIINLRNAYNPGLGNILVFVNGTFQYPITTETPDGAYFERDPDTIVFPGNQLQKEDLITVMVGRAITNVAQTVGVEVTHYQTVVSGEKLVQLPGGMYYDPGLHNLEVYVDGLLKLAQIDYVETDKHHVTFMQALPAGSIVTFKKGSVVASGTPGGTGTTDRQVTVLNTAGELYHTGTGQDQVLVLRAYNTPGDGGYGVFLYAPLMPRSQANGGTVIDPTVPLDQQGTGLGAGAWVRQYAGRIHGEWFGLGPLTMQTLTQIQNPRDGDIAELVGFHNAGDGGEGVFYWDAQAAATMHDGGTVIVPSQPFPGNWGNSVQMQAWFAPPVQGQGAWVRAGREQASIAWFGAVGDDLTDNSEVFRGISLGVKHNAIEALEIPLGNFVLAGAGGFEVEGLTKTFKLFGNGEASVVRMTAGAAAMPFLFRRCDGVEVTNLRFTDERRSAGNNGLWFMNCSDVLVHECQFDGIAQHAVAVTEDSINNTVAKCEDIRIRNNRFIHCGPQNGSAIFHAPKVESFNLDILNNYFYECGSRTSAAVEAGMATHGGLIEANYFYGSLGQAIRVAAYESMSINANTFEDFETDGIEVFVGLDPQYNAPGLMALLVTNNIFLRMQMQGDYALRVVGPSGATGIVAFKKNEVAGFGGVVFEPSGRLQGAEVSGNSFRNINAAYSAVLTSTQQGGDVENLQILQNNVENADTARTQPLLQLNGALNVLVQGNQLTGSGLSDIALTNCADAHIVSNTFLNSNLQQNGTAPVIQITDGTTAHYTVVRNVSMKGALGAFNAWTNLAGAVNPTLHDRDNIDIR